MDRPRILAAAALSLCCLALPVHASNPWQGRPFAAQDEEFAIEDLERAFWMCDYVATQEGILATPVMACRFVTEELKRRKFGGSFRELLAWWRANKAAEHLKVEHILGT